VTDPGLRRPAGARADGFGSYSAGSGGVIREKALVATLRILGGLLFAVGVVGAFVPLLPTTIFWILAAACWARSAPALRSRLLSHPRFGRALRDWSDDHAISRRGKLCAVGGMTAGGLWSWWSLGCSGYAAVLLAAGLGLIAVWIVSRPEPAHSRGGSCA
jgi:uncharacterized protein